MTIILDNWSALFRGNAALDGIVRALPGSFAAFDHEMRYVAVSERWIEEHDLPSVDAVLGMSHYQLFPNLPPHWLEAHQRCLAGERITSEADRIELPDGSSNWFCWEMTPWLAPGAERAGMIIRKEDVTEAVETKTRQEQLTAALLAAQEEAEANEKLLSTVIDLLPEGFVIYDSEDCVLLANSAERAFHGAAGEMVRPGESYERILREDLRLGLWDLEGADPEAWLEQLLATRRSQEATKTLRRLADGRWMQLNERLLSNGHVVGFRVDLTEHMTSEAALKAAETEAAFARQRMIDAIEAISDAFVVYDSEDRLVVCNEQYRKTYAGLAGVIEPGVTFEHMLRTAVERGLLPEAEGCDEAWIADRLDRHRNPRGSFEKELDGEVFLRVEERRTRTGDIVSVRTDITELKRQQRELSRYAAELSRAKAVAEEKASALEVANAHIAKAALHDPLTGLGNRRYLDQRLEQAVAAGHGVAVLHIDLDRFKQINDTLGHDAGDTVLVHVADVLRRNKRAEDAVARIGGDEFVVLCRYHGETDSLCALAKRIISALSEPLQYQGNPCRFGCSIGLAASEAGEVAPKQLVINADLALYRAKTEGRNRFEFYSESLQAEILETKRTADDILRGLESGEFVPYFQPQFCARTGEPVGAEALARWRHPERGVLTPAAFLSVADSLNVVSQIDRVIMRQAARDFMALRARGVALGRLSVNVSARRLRDPALIVDVAGLGLPHGALSVELLESILLDDADEQTSWIFDQLRELGVDIELDDFGAGRTSIVSLVRLEPRRLKIDQRLVRPIADTASAVDVVRAILDIGRSLNVEVVAEGVETLEQAQILRDLGCDILQGFVYARPMPLDALETFLTERRWRAA